MGCPNLEFQWLIKINNIHYQKAPAVVIKRIDSNVDLWNTMVEGLLKEWKNIWLKENKAQLILQSWLFQVISSILHTSLTATNLPFSQCKCIYPFWSRSAVLKF